MNSRTKARMLTVGVAGLFIVSLFAAMVTPGAALDYGQILNTQDRDVVAVYDEFDVDGLGADPTVCYVDDGGNSRYDAGDAVYLRMGADCTGNVGTNDLRLTPVGAHEAGSKVRTGDADFNRAFGPMGDFEHAFRFYDAAGNSFFGPEDAAYLCIHWDPTGTACDTTATSVAVGWVRMTGFGDEPAGSTVRSGDGDINLGTNTLGAEDDLRFWDLDGDGSFNRDDVAYFVTTDSESNPAVNHIRLGLLTGTAGFGEILASGSQEVVAQLITQGINTPAAPQSNICFADDDGDSAYDAGEPIYFVRDGVCDNVATNDLRLSSGDHAAGTKVRSADADHNRPLEVFAADHAEFRFFDAEGDGEFSAGDTAYLCLNRDAACDSSVRVGWLRLTAFGNHDAGSFVRSGDADHNLGVSDDVTPGVGYWDLNGDESFNQDDVFYLSLDEVAPVFPTTHMIRLGALEGTDGFGELLASGSLDVVPTLIDSDEMLVCFIDEDGNGAYDAGEPVYLAKQAGGTCSENVRTSDIRLTGTDPAAGSLVRSGDSDFNTPLAKPNEAQWRYYDADGNNRFSVGDTAYLCIGGGTATCGASVSIGWIRITASGEHSPGSSVASGDSDQNLATSLLAGVPDPETSAEYPFWDLDGDGTFNRNDLLYLNPGGASDHPRVNHIRLSGSEAIDDDNDIQPGQTEASFSVSTDRLSVEVDASGSRAADGTTLESFAWDFGDGSSASGITASHSYEAAGEYEITLTVTDSAGGSASTSRSVSVSDEPGPGDASASFTHAVDGLDVTFDASASSGADGASIVSYAWDFGDGQSGSGASPSHSYAEAGIYSVSLTVTDSDGNTDSVTESVTVEDDGEETVPGPAVFVLLLAVTAGVVLLRRARLE